MKECLGMESMLVMWERSTFGVVGSIHIGGTLSASCIYRGISIVMVGVSLLGSLPLYGDVSLFMQTSPS